MANKNKNTPDEILRTVQLYLILKSQLKVAETIGVTQATVSRRLIIAGCPTRPKSLPETGFDEDQWDRDVRKCIRDLHEKQRERTRSG